jgi:XTP/dITP diphosphohydrolase
MRATNIILLGSQSLAKFSEFKSILKVQAPHLELRPLSSLVFNAKALSEAENGTTYYENAFNKGKLAHLAGKYPTISDDSGLEVDALGGAPGIKSHRFAAPTSGVTQDQANIERLLKELKGVPFEKRTARFVCTLVFFVEGVVLSTTGTLEGHILESPRGSAGFGYDPIFQPAGTTLTLAEMSLEEKNERSHRGQAVAALLEQIKTRDLKLVRP